MFRFAQPYWLFALALLPLLPLIGPRLKRLARQRLDRFAQPRMAALIGEINDPRRERLAALLLGAALACLVLGVARPQWGMTHTATASRGLDIFFVVDTSRSMAATDVLPSRLDRAKRALNYLSERLSGHRLGLIQFAGVAFEACPLTQDTGTLKFLIDALDTTSLPVPGSDLGTAVNQTLEAFARSGRAGTANRVMLLISDGENFGGRPYAAVKKALGEGTKTFALGVGTPEGASITPLNPRAAIPKDAKGRPLKSKLVEKNLLSLVTVGGGIYFRLTGTGSEEELMAAELNRLDKIEQYSSRLITWDDRYPVPAVLALLLLLAERLLNRRRGRAWFSGRARRGAALLLLLALALPFPVAAESASGWIQRGMRHFRERKFPEAERAFGHAAKKDPKYMLAEYNLGCALLQQYKFAEAHQAFTRTAAKAKGRLRRDAYYNLGYNAFYLGLQQGEAERWYEAIDAFTQVLLDDPEDADARYNLEVVLREIAKRTQQTTRRETQSQANNSGQGSGSDPDKPGEDQNTSERKENDDSPPKETQEKTNQQEQQGNKTSASDQRPGNKQQGMSEQDAMRSLRSLEKDDQDLNQDRQQNLSNDNNYQGPYW